MNTLHLETSPYLLQHAHNPIHWKAWNQETLTLAQQQDKLIVVSIGYSTCHWCHVMEKESFENEEVASLMNNHFISIKVDREELPHLDNFYMKAVQIMTKQGGWPLNVVCLPNGKPIWGGTYFRRDAWIDSLSQLNKLYNEKRDTVLDFADQLNEGISLLSQAPITQEETRFNIDIQLDNWKKSFDWEYGGYSRAPKFMMPTNLLYLQKKAFLHKDEILLDYIDLTLTRMAWGGLFDTVEGGFSRYSVDHKWHIPHFEKMLYDNAQLLSVYADAYKRTKNILYKEVIEKTITFIENNWVNGDGGYFSALDADSLDRQNILEEGAYYIWTIDELKGLIKEDFKLFSIVFNINPFGHWEDGNYVLIQSSMLEQIAKENKISISDLTQKKTKWEQTLKSHRDNRPKPRLDDKTLTSWNAMYITGLLDAYTATHNKSYLDKARALYSFIHVNLWNEESGLLRTYKNGKAKIEAFLDDYAFYIQALINLFEHTGEQDFLIEAKNILDYSLDHFLDINSKFFYYSQYKKEDIITPAIETEDNVIPSSNAIMAMNMIKLGVLYENQYYTELATSMVERVLSIIDYPSAYSHWLLLQLYLNQPLELTWVGKNAVEQNILSRHSMNTRSLIFSIATKSTIPYLSKYTVLEDTLHYICINKTCQAPSANHSELENHIL
ncbi:thioredoxin domain-containing protein [Myroides sp. M-43]|uniref:thioredoxin domain-containing protein n=1 Tax=Myroides oncorhynchi TaxID=2893756 RepID=UPI001E57CB21|nr:thioredoxin domain-containing protein [Myroides oncorhynchi]MCC9042679.1 thioredoxin domain-containing protein [Myroides oncorhynchi]